MRLRSAAVPFSLTLSPCWTCGYDLTGNVSGECSECGTIMKGPLDEGCLMHWVWRAAIGNCGGGPISP